MSERTIKDVVEQIGMGRFQYKMMAVCGLFYMSDAMEVKIF